LRTTFPARYNLAMTHDTIDTTEAARILGTSLRGVRLAIRRGRLRANRVEVRGQSVWTLRRADVLAYDGDRQRGPKPGSKRKKAAKSAGK
jgi:hypothetical protein